MSEFDRQKTAQWSRQNLDGGELLEWAQNASRSAGSLAASITEHAAEFNGSDRQLLRDAARLLKDAERGLLLVSMPRHKTGPAISFLALRAAIQDLHTESADATRQLLTLRDSAGMAEVRVAHLVLAESREVSYALKRAIDSCSQAALVRGEL